MGWKQLSGPGQAREPPRSSLVVLRPACGSVRHAPGRRMARPVGAAAGVCGDVSVLTSTLFSSTVCDHFWFTRPNLRSVVRLLLPTLLGFTLPSCEAKNSSKEDILEVGVTAFWKLQNKVTDGGQGHKDRTRFQRGLSAAR